MIIKGISDPGVGFNPGNGSYPNPGTTPGGGSVIPGTTIDPPTCCPYQSKTCTSCVGSNSPFCPGRRHL